MKMKIDIESNRIGLNTDNLSNIYILHPPPPAVSLFYLLLLFWDKSNQPTTTIPHPNTHNYHLNQVSGQKNYKFSTSTRNLPSLNWDRIHRDTYRRPCTAPTVWRSTHCYRLDSTPGGQRPQLLWQPQTEELGPAESPFLKVDVLS